MSGLRLYPTVRAVALTAAGAPVALAASLFAPGFWAVAASWVLLAAGLMVVDVFLAARPGGLVLTLSAPRALGVGRRGAAVVALGFEGRSPALVELAVEADVRLGCTPVRQTVAIAGGAGQATLDLAPHRRGEAAIAAAWARWRGPLGLAWVQQREILDRPVAVTADVEGVKEQALRLFARDTPLGLKPMVNVGEGADFHALLEYQTGMDPRAIDWKQSARHGKLVAREFRAERNHRIVLALDTGRLMSTPLAGLPRIDHAINAALLLAFVSLQMGDRAGLFAFDARPHASSGAVSGAQAFPLLQALAARIDYSTEETNFTLGLSTLSAQLDRRALIVIFTDFMDPTSAELMIENLGRLMRTHLVLFVVFREGELEAMREAAPTDADDVARAVMADQLLRQREVVTARLRRMGAQIVEAPAGVLGPALVDAYLAVKRRELV